MKWATVGELAIRVERDVRHRSGDRHVAKLREKLHALVELGAETLRVEKSSDTIGHVASCRFRSAVANRFRTGAQADRAQADVSTMKTPPPNG